MIDTTELRRLRDVAAKGPWVPYEDTDWIHQADDYESQPFIGFAANHAHAIADELDALREWKAIEQQHLISSGTALLFAGWRGDGSVTDAVKWACGELDELRKRVAELEEKTSLYRRWLGWLCQGIPWLKHARMRGCTDEQIVELTAIVDGIEAPIRMEEIA